MLLWYSKDIIAYVWLALGWYHLMGVTWLLFQTEECTTEKWSLLSKEHLGGVLWRFFLGGRVCFVFKEHLLTATNLGISSEKIGIILGKGHFPNKQNLGITVFSCSGVPKENSSILNCIFFHCQSAIST